MTTNEAAEKICEIAVESIEAARDDDNCSWVDFATVLEKAANAVEGLMYGPQGGNYKHTYHQWTTARPLGLRDGSETTPGE